MLKVKLSSPFYSKNKYVVYLDSDVKREFSNKRSAETFKVIIEHELNQALLFINEEFSTLTQFYRCYFLADRDHRFKYEVENCFDLVDNRLKYVSIHTASINYNALIVQAINISFEELKNVCGLICKKSITRYDTITKHRIELQARIIDNYIKGFKEFNVSSVFENQLKVKTI